MLSFGLYPILLHETTTLSSLPALPPYLAVDDAMDKTVSWYQQHVAPTLDVNHLPTRRLSSIEQQSLVVMQWRKHYTHDDLSALKAFACASAAASIDCDHQHPTIVIDWHGVAGYAKSVDVSARNQSVYVNFVQAPQCIERESMSVVTFAIDSHVQWLEQELERQASSADTKLFVVIVEQSPLAMTDVDKANQLRLLLSDYSHSIDVLLLGATRNRGDTIALLQQSSKIVGFESQASLRRYDIVCHTSTRCVVDDFHQFAAVDRRTHEPATLDNSANLQLYWQFAARALLLLDSNWFDLPRLLVNASPSSSSSSPEKIKKLSPSIDATLFPDEKLSKSSHTSHHYQIACALKYTRDAVVQCVKLLQQLPHNTDKIIDLDEFPSNPQQLIEFKPRFRINTIALIVALFPNSKINSIS